ncbi:MAG TPA: cytochrome c [Bacteroidia bacterium]|jgi:mono/diheme cytochrome c family protein|nr:cytochrome c [Bacteroidia bacterium]
MDKEKAGRKFIGKAKISFKGIVGLVAMAAIAVAVFYIAKHHKPSDAYVKNLPELNEQGNKQWSDADKYLPGQTFTLNASQDTIIQTKGGLVIAVPANCFVDDNGKPVTGHIELEVKEALDAASMMRAGLSTKAGSDLLESAGMFYLNGRKDGKSLKINPNNGIYVRVPADSVKTGMQAFEGKRMPDGSIDWVNPKPLLRNLVPVDIHTLNFYPPLYLDSLAMWGKDVKNKNYTDSLYYSFASLFGENQMDQTATPTASADDINEGGKLFRANCAVCHSIGSNRITGAGMEGITEKVPQPYTTWLLKYIKNYPKLIKSGDTYARKVTIESPALMTVFEGVLTDSQIYSIIDYLSIQEHKSDSVSIFNYPNDTAKHDSRLCGINPAKIKAIWNDKFQNTLIATKEFEERMPYIHQTGQNAILDLYVNNLDKNLSYIDSLAAMQLGEDLKAKFLSFAARGDGKVVIKSSLFEKLKAFFEKKSILFTEAASKAQKAYEEKQNKLDALADKKVTADTNRSNQMRGNEYKENLKAACRQVGDPDSIGKVDKNGYAVLCTTPGWTNLDAYVWASTYNRTTLEYTSSTNGKKAEIKYLPFSITVNDYSKYDNVFVYLLPNKLNSFMRVSDTNGKFKENLDEIFSYGLECIAYKGNQAYYYSMDNVLPKEYSGINLLPVSAKELDKELNSHGNKNQQDDMDKEVDYMKFENEDKKRRKQNEEIVNFRNRVERVIFKCPEG